MEFILILLMAAAVFGICHFVDKCFAKAFRSKAQHRSGLAVRVSKLYGIFGVILICLGILALCTGIAGSTVLIFGGIFVMFMGVWLACIYLFTGIFYDGESFLHCRLGKQDASYSYRDIKGQKLYLIQGGSIVIELHMADGTAVSLQSTMDGVYPFLDTAFAGWCMLTGTDPQSCDFHDPSQSLWFPTVEET